MAIINLTNAFNTTWFYSKKNVTYYILGETFKFKAQLKIAKAGTLYIWEENTLFIGTS